MAATYTPIASITLGADTATVNFTSIPQTYTDLILVTNAGHSTTANFLIRLNSDTGSNYSVTRLSGNGSAASSARTTSATSFGMTGQSYIDSAITFNSIVHFQNYSNTTTNKTILGKQNLAAGGVDLVAGLYRSTSAVTSINLLLSTGTYDSGSTFNLYGILGANA